MMNRSRGTSIEFELSPAGHLDPIAAGVTCRWGGCSKPPFDTLNLGRSTDDAPEHVRENEARVLAAARIPNNVARLRLEHGSRVLNVTSPGLYGPADAILTSNPHLTLWLTVADCYPLVVAGGGLCILGHCGWRGIAAGIVETMMRTVSEFGDLPPNAFRAWIGPGIGSCCYSVGPDVACRFEKESARSIPGEDRFRVDLANEIRVRLITSGVNEGSVAASGMCTSCNTDRFFSHRAEHGRTGRMVALAWTAGSGGLPLRPGDCTR